MTSLLELTPAPKLGRRLGWLGMDIGSHMVKLAQVERAGELWKLRIARSIPVPAGVDALEIGIRAAKEALGSRARWFNQQVACTMSVHAEMRNIDVPNLEWNELDRHVAAQMGPASESRLFSCWPSSLSEQPREERPFHLLMIDKQPAVDFTSRLLKSGAECEVLDSMPACLARAALLVHSNPTDTVAVFDWSYNSPMFTVVRNGQPYYSRALRDCGFNSLLAAVANATGLNENAAELLLRRLHETTGDDVELTHTNRVLRRAIASQVRVLLDELDRTVSFLGTEGRQGVPTQVYFVGGGACVPNLADEFSDRIGIPAAVWELPQPIEQHSHNIQTTNISHFASAISLSAIPLLS